MRTDAVNAIVNVRSLYYAAQLRKTCYIKLTNFSGTDKSKRENQPLHTTDSSSKQNTQIKTRKHRGELKKECILNQDIHSSVLFCEAPTVTQYSSTNILLEGTESVQGRPWWVTKIESRADKNVIVSRLSERF